MMTKERRGRGREGKEGKKKGRKGKKYRAGTGKGRERERGG